MFDFGIGTSELLIIAVVALLVVGPRDLPKLLRSIGQFTTKIRGMAREFQRHLDDAMRETGVDEVKKQVSEVTNLAGTAADLKKEETDLKKALEAAAPKADAPKVEPPLTESIAAPPEIKPPSLEKPAEKPVPEMAGR
jgi:sec-independent protein translocase protein TatB